MKSSGIEAATSWFVAQCFTPHAPQHLWQARHHGTAANSHISH